MTRELIANAVGGKLPEPVLAELETRSDGVPLFVEELTSSVVTSGVMTEKAGHYELSGSLKGATGPNPVGLLGQTWVATDHSDGPTRGNVYMLCSVDPSGPDPLDVHFVRSEDGGSTWSDPVRVNDDSQFTLAWPRRAERLG